ncbi:uncharacterized protein EI97DRAFT_430226 [Westerdykella ornata]|uniref:GPI anchored protein n=1 Tax=Westerdykella ornata TaxID=318751 RepID=A0A6A6JWR8_WESOR|nr:uncharacterized protein EI97DRAFT_430226 [Westerdykella ornata]KAF2280523.1 hypothetical protein EI97DRAFT_430226 [Westerdykella ornata]
MRSPFLASAVLLLAQAMPSRGQTRAQLFTVQTSMPSVPVEAPTDLPVPTNPPGSLSDDTMSVGPIEITDSFSVSIPPELSSLLATDSGIMSIPAGETPLSTGDLSNTTRASHTSTPSSSTTPSASTSQSPTSAAALGQTAGRSGSLLVATVSGLSLAVGFAWLLL